MKRCALLSLLLMVSLATAQTHSGGDNQSKSIVFTPPQKADTSLTLSETEADDAPYRNAWGLDVLVSNDGFGLGTFYRREFTEDLFGFASLSVSEAKDDREVEQYSPYTYQTYIPGKLQRFIVIPLMFGVQKRLFSEEITDNFRPFVNAGVGPTLILSAPFTEFTTLAPGVVQANQVEFFKSLGRAKAHYTAGGFIGVGANFGSEKANVFGVNFRYYFTYLFGNGLPSLYKNDPLGEVLATKKDFGGFFITLNVGMAY